MALGFGFWIGLTGADLLSRWSASLNPTATPAPALPSGVTSIAQYNDYAVAAKPGLARIGWQMLLGAVGIAGGMFAPWSALKLFSYGVGLGAIGHALMEVGNAYIFEPLFGTTNMGHELFTHEQNANSLLNPPTPAAGASGAAGAPPPPQRSRFDQPQQQRQIPTAPAARLKIPPAMGNMGAVAAAPAMVVNPTPTPAPTPAPTPMPSPNPPPAPAPNQGPGACQMGAPPVPELPEPTVSGYRHPMFAAKRERAASYLRRVA